MIKPGESRTPAFKNGSRIRRKDRIPAIQPGLCRQRLLCRYSFLLILPFFQIGKDFADRDHDSELKGVSVR